MVRRSQLDGEKMVGSLSEAEKLVNGLKSERNQKALGLCSEGSSSG